MIRIILLLIISLSVTACQSAPTSPTRLIEQPSPSLTDADPALENSDEENCSITLAFAGDTMMAGRVAEIVKEEGVDYPFADTTPIFQESDLAMLNLETAISHRAETKMEKEYTFQSEPAMADAMKRAGVDLVTIANNHALDYGRDAFLDTIDYLTNAKIQYVGGGVNQTEAYAAKIFSINGKSLQFFGFSRVFPQADWHAGSQRPGMASAYDPENVYRHIEPSIEEHDYTIVYLHWGEELADEPLPYQTELARGLIDRGVDLVIGSHPHVLQGLEWYQGKLIAYSLGNFVFTTSLVEEARQTAILRVTLREEEIIPQVIPMYIDRGAVWLANEEQRQKVLDRMRRLSTGGAWDNDIYKWMRQTND